MSSGSLRDVLKSLHNALTNTEYLDTLPEHCQSQITTYLESHESVESSDAQRLQEDLINAYHKYVVKDDEKRVIFLQALRLLRPAIWGLNRSLEWWKIVVCPTLDSVGRKRLEIDHAGAYVLGILNFDKDEDKEGERAKESTHISKLLIAAYMKRTSHAVGDDDEYSIEDLHIANQLEEIIIEYGRKRPKDLMTAVDNLTVDQRTRVQALGLLAAFVHHQTPHLYLVAETALIEHLLQCLMTDTSTIAIQQALSCLIMFLPHIPSSILTHLTRLFLIYARLLCWERIAVISTNAEQNDKGQQEKGDEPTDQPVTSGSAWEKLEASALPEEKNIELTYYFTFLYGLYPLNFTSFIRKPRRYLKSINFPRADELELDQDFIKTRTEHYTRTHFLHPNFYNTTVEDELTDEHWLKSDPADVVAECMGLRLSTVKNVRTPGPPPNKKLPELPSEYVRTADIPDQDLLSVDDDSSTFANSLADVKSINGSDKPQGFGALPRTSSPHRSTAGLSRTPSRNIRHAGTPKQAGSPSVRSQPGDSPTLPPLPHPQLQSTLGPRVASNSSFLSVKEKSAGALASPAPRKSTSTSSAVLTQKLTLLTNDLHFERYLKQQHLAHIAELQRSRIGDATISANTQNLLHTNKSLKAKLAKASDAYAVLKKESTTSRTQSKKLETELSSKVRTLREAERAWRTQEENLRVDLGRAQQESAALRKIVVDTESRELLSEQRLDSSEIQLDGVHALKKRVGELDTKVKTLEAGELEAKRAADERDILQVELATANLQLQSNDGTQERNKKVFQKRIADLETRLRDAEDAGMGQGELPERAKHMVEAANARWTSLKKEYATLRHAHVELELRCKELESEAADVVDASGTGYASKARQIEDDSEYASSHNSGSPLPIRSESTPNKPPRSRLMSQSGTTISSSAPPGVQTKHPPPLPPQIRTSGSEFGRRNVPRSYDSGGPDSDAGSGFYSSNKSAFSMESLASGMSKESGVSKTSSKVTKNSDTRVFGRGGSQNVGKKDGVEEGEKKPKKSANKGIGIRGFKGLI
ncbi:MAG: hypothetical protein M1828_003392 [Chrysothrix sp. TS-e1954]|nr:MAG: hypothetical protein M1828_003392 [Chrysothrix sp. TS-e1954]